METGEKTIPVNDRANVHEHALIEILRDYTTCRSESVRLDEWVEYWRKIYSNPRNGFTSNLTMRLSGALQDKLWSDRWPWEKS